MKQKLIISLIISCLKINLLFGQNPDYKVGTPFSTILEHQENSGLLNTSYYKSDVLFNTEGNLVNIKSHKNSVVIQLYSTSEMKEIQRKNYFKIQKKFTYIKTVNLKNKFLFFYSIKNKGNESVFVRELDTKNCLLKDSVLLFTTKLRVNHTFNHKQNYRKNDFQILFSSDSSKFLIQYDKELPYSYETYPKDIICFHVFDNHINKVFESQLEIPYTVNNVNRLTSLLSNEGNVFNFLYEHESMSLKVFKCDTQLKMNEYSININDSISFIDFKFLENTEGNIIGASFYQNGSKHTLDSNNDILLSCNGIITIELNQKGEKLNYKLFDFKNNNYNTFLNGFKSLDLIQYNDKFILTGESSFFSERLIMNRLVYEFYYGKIVEFVFDSKQNPVYVNIIDKNQISHNNKSEMGLKTFSTANSKLNFYVEDIEENNLIETQSPLFIADNNRFLFISKLEIDKKESKQSIVFNLSSFERLYPESKLRTKLIISQIYKQSDNVYFLEIEMGNNQQSFVKLILP